jgi:hypothetical protein
MAIILYEGFNYNTTDIPKIDTTYWSSNNLAGISYTAGRTNNQIRIPSFAANEPNSAANSLTLSNFSDPLATNNCFGMGFYHESSSLMTRVELAPARMKYMEFKNTSDETVLEFNLIRTTYNSLNSIAIEVVQNNNVITLYDFRSYVGHTWTFNGSNFIQSPIYLEFFIDAKNDNNMSLRVSQDGGTIHGYLLNSSNQQTTSITGFSSLKSVTWYGGHDNYGIMTLDDLYFSRGDSAEECYLGANTKIYRLNLDGNGSTIQWTTNNGNSQFGNLQSADGDASYAFASINLSGLVSIFGMQNISPIPSGDLSIIVKPINIVRKTSNTNNAKFINVMNSGSGPIVDLGSEYTVTSNTYAHASSNYITINPITGNPWTITDINDMQIGIKNLGMAS